MYEAELHSDSKAYTKGVRDLQLTAAVPVHADSDVGMNMDECDQEYHDDEEYRLDDDDFGQAGITLQDNVTEQQWERSEYVVQEMQVGVNCVNELEATEELSLDEEV